MKSVALRSPPKSSAANERRVPLTSHTKNSTLQAAVDCCYRWLATSHGATSGGPTLLVLALLSRTDRHRRMCQCGPRHGRQTGAGDDRNRPPRGRMRGCSGRSELADSTSAHVPVRKNDGIHPASTPNPPALRLRLAHGEKCANTAEVRREILQARRGFPHRACS